MYSFLILLLTYVLVCRSDFVSLKILMQRSRNNDDLGVLLSSYTTKSVLEGETAKTFTGWAICENLIFFIASLLLAIAYISRKTHASDNIGKGNLLTFTEIIKK
ncbi:MAG: hypothetical protein LBF25_01855 [Puniceicoccales bacterium]|jgi:hypothetical protein|nr:hypothetical protein [Puniceicoccales bacterium]